MRRPRVLHNIGAIRGRGMPRPYRFTRKMVWRLGMPSPNLDELPFC